MTLLQAMELGETGTEIDYLLNEIKDAIHSPEDFEDTTAQAEYIEDTISMIKTELTKLKEK